MKVHDFVFSDGTVRSVEVFDVQLSFLIRTVDCVYRHSCLRGVLPYLDYGSPDNIGCYVLVAARHCDGVPFAKDSDYLTLMIPRRDLEAVGRDIEGVLGSRLPINDLFEQEICDHYGVPNTYHDVFEVWHIVDRNTDDVEVFEVPQSFLRDSLLFDGSEYYDGRYVPMGFDDRFGGVSTGVDYVTRDHFTGEPWPDVSVGRWLVVNAWCRFATVNQVYLMECCRTLADAYEAVMWERIEERACYGGFWVDEYGHTWCSNFEIWHVVPDTTPDVKRFVLDTAGFWSDDYQRHDIEGV